MRFFVSCWAFPRMGSAHNPQLSHIPGTSTSPISVAYFLQGDSATRAPILNACALLRVRGRRQDVARSSGECQYLWQGCRCALRMSLRPFSPFASLPIRFFPSLRGNVLCPSVAVNQMEASLGEKQSCLRAFRLSTPSFSSLAPPLRRPPPPSDRVQPSSVTVAV